MEFKRGLKEWLDQAIHSNLQSAYHYIPGFYKDVYIYESLEDACGALTFISDFIYSCGDNKSYEIKFIHNKLNSYEIHIILQ